MSEDDDSFEAKARWLAEEIGRSMERLGELDIDEIVESIGVDVERAKQFADRAGRWLQDQTEALSKDGPFWGPERGGSAADRGPLRPAGPHPLDTPTADQGVALSALDSGRWTVEPGSSVLLTHGEGPDPDDAQGLVGELRARDWITAEGAVTLVGRNALGRWLEGSDSP